MGVGQRGICGEHLYADHFWENDHKGLDDVCPRTHGNVFLRFCIVYCSQGNREQPAHYLKQYKNAGKDFRVYRAYVCRLLTSLTLATRLLDR